MSAPHPLQPVLPVFEAIVRTVAPASAGLDDAGWNRALATVADALSSKPPAMIRQLVLFLRIVNLLSVLRFLRPLPAVPPHRAERLLARLERFPVLLIRRGLWGVRTLGFMAFYTGADTAERIGYAAAAAGWDARPNDAWTGRNGGAPPEPDVVDMMEKVAER